MQEQKLTGYPSIDKPWLKYYSEEDLNVPIPESSIYEYVWENNKMYLNNIALEYFGNKITYKDFFEMIDKVANAFKKMGVKKGTIVTLALPNMPENIYCIYALNKIGAIFDLIDLRSKGDALLHYYNETKSEIVVICDMFVQNTIDIVGKTNIKKMVVVSLFDSAPWFLRLVMMQKKSFRKNKKCILWKDFIKKVEGSCETEDNSSESIICILHTSGTTGISKGVMLSNRNFLAMVNQVKNSGLIYERSDVFLNQVPPFLAYNVLAAVNNPLSMGLQVTLLPDYKPNKFSDNIYKYKSNHAIAGPADWESFLKNPKVKKRNYSFLKTMISGSDKIEESVKTQINTLLSQAGCKENILEGYGLTEVGAAAIMNLPQRNIANSVGIPLKNVNVCIYNNELDCELQYNEVGEICMSGETVMQGYYGRRDETDNVIKLHNDGNKWLHTGDFGRIDENGNVYLEGRLKRLIVRYDGIKISPFTIEKIVNMNSNVEACCVVGMPDVKNSRGYLPIVYVKLVDSSLSNTIDEIRNMCEQELSSNYFPKDYKVIGEIPLTDNGKVDYRKLEKMARE